MCSSSSTNLKLTKFSPTKLTEDREGGLYGVVGFGVTYGTGQSISFMPEYNNVSFEEVRLAHYSSTGKFNDNISKMASILKSEEESDATKSQLSSLECSVCFETCCPPITACLSGHNTCNSCKSNAKDDLCQVCNDAYVGTRNVVREKSFPKLKLTEDLTKNTSTPLLASDEVLPPAQLPNCTLTSSNSASSFDLDVSDCDSYFSDSECAKLRRISKSVESTKAIAQRAPFLAWVKSRTEINCQNGDQMTPALVIPKTTLFGKSPGSYRFSTSRTDPEDAETETDDGRIPKFVSLPTPSPSKTGSLKPSSSRIGQLMTTPSRNQIGPTNPTLTQMGSTSHATILNGVGSRISVVGSVKTKSSSTNLKPKVSGFNSVQFSKPVFGTESLKESTIKNSRPNRVHASKNLFCEKSGQHGSGFVSRIPKAKSILNLDQQLENTGLGLLDSIPKEILNLESSHIACSVAGNLDVAVATVDSGLTASSENSGCGVTLTNPKYYCSPSIENLEKMVNCGKCLVQDFEIGHKKHGKLLFLGEVDVFGLNIDKTVQFNTMNIHISGDCPPPIGFAQPCLVTLNNVFLSDNESNARPLVDACSEFGGEYVSYEPDSGVLKFKMFKFPKIV